MELFSNVDVMDLNWKSIESSFVRDKDAYVGHLSVYLRAEEDKEKKYGLGTALITI